MRAMKNRARILALDTAAPTVRGTGWSGSTKSPTDHAHGDSIRAESEHRANLVAWHAFQIQYRQARSIEPGDARN